MKKYFDEFNVEYTLKADGTYELTKCHNAKIAEYDILSEIDGVAVTSIGELAFMKCQNLKKMVVPEGITKIGRWAFSNCYNGFKGDQYEPYGLEEVYLPKSLKEIGDYAFEESRVLTKVCGLRSDLKIGAYAFYNCRRLCCFSDDVAEIPEGSISIKAYGAVCMMNLMPKGEKYDATAFRKCICLVELGDDEDCLSTTASQYDYHTPMSFASASKRSE